MISVESHAAVESGARNESDHRHSRSLDSSQDGSHPGTGRRNPETGGLVLAVVAALSFARFVIGDGRAP